MATSQNQRVLDLLRRRGSQGLTQMDCFAASPPITRLSARVLDLRRAGHDIVTIKCATPHSRGGIGLYARYVLVHEAGQE